MRFERVPAPFQMRERNTTDPFHLTRVAPAPQRSEQRALVTRPGQSLTILAGLQSAQKALSEGGIERVTDLKMLSKCGGPAACSPLDLLSEQRRAPNLLRGRPIGTSYCRRGRPREGPQRQHVCLAAAGPTATCKSSGSGARRRLRGYVPPKIYHMI